MERLQFDVGEGEHDKDAGDGLPAILHGVGGVRDCGVCGVRAALLQ